MSIASFDEEQQLVQQTASAPTRMFRGMSGWLVEKGLAANQTSADLTLVVLAGLCVALAIFMPLLFGGRSSDSVSKEKIRAAIPSMTPAPVR